MLGMHFYRARHPISGADADLRDASCRPDPDFDALTLGLCRPTLRSGLARRAKGDEPVDLLFYTREKGSRALLLTALLRIQKSFPDHNAARASFKKAPPRNLIVRDNPCLLGTVVDPHTGRSAGHVAKSSCDCKRCGCEKYARRADTPYLVLSSRPGSSRRLRLANPVRLEMPELVSRAPHYFRQWPKRISLEGFQKVTQNSAHWFDHPGDAEALSRLFQSEC